MRRRRGEERGRSEERGRKGRESEIRKETGEVE